MWCRVPLVNQSSFRFSSCQQFTHIPFWGISAEPWSFSELTFDCVNVSHTTWCDTNMCISFDCLVFTRFPVSFFRSTNSVGLSAPPLSALITPEPVRHSRIPSCRWTAACCSSSCSFFICWWPCLSSTSTSTGQWWYPYSHPAASTSLVRTHTHKYTHFSRHTPSALLSVATWNHLYEWKNSCWIPKQTWKLEHLR